MRRRVVASLGVVVVLAMVSGTTPAQAVTTPANVDVSRRPFNENEEAIAINPTDPNNIVIVTNLGRDPGFSDAGMFEGVSFDGGHTWRTSIIGTGAEGDPLEDACCDPSLSFDQFGNLFMTYLDQDQFDVLPIALSTDGGSTFRQIARITSIGKRNGKAAPAGDGRGLFRYVDQPTITAAEGAVWVVASFGGTIGAFGAPVSGFGEVGSFVGEVAANTSNCTYGDVAIGPEGQVMQACSLGASGQGAGKVFVSVDPDGLGPAGFGDRVFVDDSHVGGFDYIAPQPDRSVDSEVGLAWDRTGGPHDGRVYAVYTLETKNESDDTDVLSRYSDDDGQTWSAPIRVNDDSTTNSQFLPKLALDQTSGNLAVVWYDARRDDGSGGEGDTNGAPNDDAQFWGAFSTTGGVSFTPNVQISAGTSNAVDSNNPLDYGDYSGLAFYGGVARPAWADNSNSTGDNPDGALHGLDIYTAAVRAG